MFQLVLVFSLLLLSSAEYQAGHLRLVGGSYQWEGRVEIYMSGTWSTVADSQWSSDDAQVVCRQLGHFEPGAIPRSAAYFGEGSGLGQIGLKYVNCSGVEYSLLSCQTSSDSEQSWSGVGVQCQPGYGAYKEGDIRLVGGSHDWEGRVEVYKSGTWGAISDDSWTTDDATVVCHQLGHSSSGAVPHCCTHYGQGSVVCSGSEPNITNCSHSATSSGHRRDVGVRCQPRTMSGERPGTIRLVGGSNAWEGRVEIYLSETWGRVSSAYYHQTKAASVVCRQLGYSGGLIPTHCCDDFGHNNSPILISITECSGSEHRLTECIYDTDTLDKPYIRDWGVVCNTDGPEMGDIRMYRYGHHGFGHYGHVEMFVSGTWITVTGNWTTKNSQVACRQLGYLRNGSTIAGYLNDTGPNLTQFIRNVSCTGSESRLINCPHNIVQNGTESNDFALKCQASICMEGDTRLVGGKTETEGRVEMCWHDRHYYDYRGYGKWGTICDNQWSSAHSEVLCRSLGFAPQGVATTSSTFGPGTGPILMDYVNCSGSESRLIDCHHFTHSHGCTHNDDVGIRCQPAECENGQVRVVRNSTLEENGFFAAILTPNGLSGRVEVCFNQRWGSVMEHSMSQSSHRKKIAEVLCRQLGYSPTNSFLFHSVEEVDGVGPIHMKDVECTGTEYRILDCSYKYDAHVLFRRDVGVHCDRVHCQDGEVRLVEGETEWKGRLEVCLSQRWGTVSSDEWSVADAQVVCRDLGYEMNANDAPYAVRPATRSQPIFLDNVACHGTEFSLLYCSYDSDTSEDDHSKDVTLQCQQPSCEDGDIRLVNGDTERDGLLEVCFDHRWGTVNGNVWSDTDTQVVCRQLGYQTADNSYYWAGHKRKVSTPIYMNNVACYGQESKLTDCSFGTDTAADQHSDDIGVRCNGETDDTSSSSHTDASSTNSPALGMAVLSLVLVTLTLIAAVPFIIIRGVKKNPKGSDKTPLKDSEKSSDGDHPKTMSEDKSALV